MDLELNTRLVQESIKAIETNVIDSLGDGDFLLASKMPGFTEKMALLGKLNEAFELAGRISAIQQEQKDRKK